MSRIHFQPTMEDLFFLRSFNSSDEMRHYLEEAVGKPYAQITIGEINELFPGIYDDLLSEGVAIALDCYKKLRQQVWGF